MTLTAPIPIVELSLADLIRVGIHPVRHEARLHPAITFGSTVDSDRLRDQLRTAQGSVVRAIERTLDSVNVPTTEGSIEWTLGRDEREWTLTGVWRPR